MSMTRTEPHTANNSKKETTAMTGTITFTEADNDPYTDYEFYLDHEGGMDWKAAFFIDNETGEVTQPLFFSAPDDGVTPYEEAAGQPPQALLARVTAHRAGLIAKAREA